MRHRRHAQAGAEGVNLGLIVTPMLDMAFQLLSFFVMTYHPPTNQGYISGALVPPSQFAVKGPKSDQISEDPPVIDPDTTESLEVAVESNLGLIERVWIEHDDPNADPLRVVDDNAPKKADEKMTKRRDKIKKLVYARVDEDKKGFMRDLLKAELDTYYKAAKDTQKAKIRLSADYDLYHEHTMEVYDVIRTANFTNVNFTNPLKKTP